MVHSSVKLLDFRTKSASHIAFGILYILIQYHFIWVDATVPSVISKVCECVRLGIPFLNCPELYQYDGRNFLFTIHRDLHYAFSATRYCNESLTQFRQVVNGWLPAVLFTLWNNLLVPRALYQLARLDGSAASLHEVEHLMVHWWFLYDVFSGFMGAMLGTRTRENWNLTAPRRWIAISSGK